jgi:hypothetical protein
MDQAVEARFERIERLLTQAAELAVGNQNALVLLAKHSEALQNTVIDLTKTVSHYIATADTRMKAMETSLENLIRIIAAEHSNGKRHD